MQINFLLNSISILDGESQVLLNRLQISDLIGVQEHMETPVDTSREFEKNSFINYFRDEEDSVLWRYGIKVICK